MFIEVENRTLTVEMAKAAGFSHAAYAVIEDMDFNKDVRDMCAANKCGKYNKCWACPPACGTLEELREKVLQYDYAMILQATEKMEDDYDWEAIEKAGERCKESLAKLSKQLKSMGKKIFPMGNGGCDLCAECSYPDAPCRFPEDLNFSMEACGLFVNRECKKAGLEYNYGRQTMTIIASIFVKEE